MSVVQGEGRRTRLIDTSLRLVSAGLAWSLMVVLVLAGGMVIVQGALESASFGLGLAVLDASLLVALALALAAPLGIAAAIWAEARPRHPGVRRFVDFDLSVLDSVPPFVFGLAVVVLVGQGLGWGGGLASGGVALAGMLLPGIIAGARVALAEVSWPQLEAGYALGGSRARLLVHVVLPAAARGLAAVVCRGAARAFGSAAPLLMLVWLAPSSSGRGVEGALAVSVFEALAADEPVGASILVLVLVAGGLELLARLIEPSPHRAGEAQ